MKASGTLSRLLIAVGITIAFEVGYLMATVSSDNGDRKELGVRRNANFGRGEGQSVSQERSLPEVKTYVFECWEASPAAIVDFDLRDETLSLLEKIPVADLEVWMRELRSEYDTDWDKDIPMLLREMVMQVLAERCGASFIRSLEEDPLEYGEIDLDQVMDYWIKHDPAAVLESLDGNNLPEFIIEDRDKYSEDALEELAGKDVDEFERRLTTVDADTRESVLEAYAYRKGTTENRAEILGRAPQSSHGEAMALYQGLILREAARDPERGYTTLREIKVSDSDRTLLEERLVVSLMSDYGFNAIQKDKTGVMQDWVKRNPDQEVSWGILSSFESWSRVSFEEANVWVARQPSGPQFDSFALVLIGQRVDGHVNDIPKVADLATRINDPRIRAEANRRLRESWQSKDEEAASEWEGNLSAEDQEQLNRASTKE